jgi:hypothetical protein
MSMMACSYCGDFHDTDDGEGQWDVPRFVHPRRTSPFKYDYICGVCCEKYINEEGEFDEDLPEREAHLTEGDRMASLAEDNCVKGAFYLMDAINGRKGNPEGREAVREILTAAVNRQKQA